MKTEITMCIEHNKPVPNLWDLIAGRAYTIDGVSDVTRAPLHRLHILQHLLVYKSCLAEEEYQALLGLLAT